MLLVIIGHFFGLPNAKHSARPSLFGAPPPRRCSEKIPSAPEPSKRCRASPGRFLRNGHFFGQRGSALLYQKSASSHILWDEALTAPRFHPDCAAFRPQPLVAPLTRDRRPALRQAGGSGVVFSCSLPCGAFSLQPPLSLKDNREMGTVPVNAFFIFL